MKFNLTIDLKQGQKVRADHMYPQSVPGAK